MQKLKVGVVLLQWVFNVDLEGALQWGSGWEFQGIANMWSKLQVTLLEDNIWSGYVDFNFHVIPLLSFLKFEN